MHYYDIVKTEDEFITKIKCLRPDKGYPKGHVLNVRIHKGAVFSSVTLAEGVQLGNLARIEDRTIIGANTKIHSQVRIGPNCRIGRNCNIKPATSIHEGAVLEERTRIGYSCLIGPYAYLQRLSSIGNKCRIGSSLRALEGSKIKGSLVAGHNLLVERGAQFTEDMEVGDNVTLQSGSKLNRHVRIGNGVTIPKNTRIPRESIIVDNAVVPSYNYKRTIVMNKPTDIITVRIGKFHLATHPSTTGSWPVQINDLVKSPKAWEEYFSFPDNRKNGFDAFNHIRQTIALNNNEAK